MANRMTRVAALVTLLVVAFAGMYVAAQSNNRTYVWHGEFVSLDQPARTMTVKAPFRDAVAGYIGQFKPGQRIILAWDLIGTIDTDTVLYVATYEFMKISRVDVGYILPAEFVSADTTARTITFKTRAPDNMPPVQPGQWVKVTTPMNQPAETATIASAVALSTGRPQLTPRPRTAPQAAPEITKVATTEDYSKAMKAIGGAFGAVNKAIQSDCFIGQRLERCAVDAETQLAIARATMMEVQAFWVRKKKDDPAMIAKDSIAKMDALGEALSEGGISNAALAAAARDVGGTCAACHGKYREQDPATKAFSFKAGTL